MVYLCKNIKSSVKNSTIGFCVFIRLNTGSLEKYIWTAKSLLRSSVAYFVNDT